MNDKEKLISFINKGKENKPVKEVHVIKDSPTEAHILLVNEDGTNVASNRFEIMDAHDLMSLIENPSDSGLFIDISEDNKKVNIKIDEINKIATIGFDEIGVEEDARWPNLSGLISYLSNLTNNAYTNYYIGLRHLEYENITENLKIEFDKLYPCFPFIMNEGYIDKNSFLFKFLIDEEEESITPIVYVDGQTASFNGVAYPLLLTEYQAYKAVNGPLYIPLYF